MYLYISEKKFIPEFKGVGNIYIDILKKNPYNNSANKAMIYCAGPDGTQMNESNIKKYNISSDTGDKMVERIFLSYVNIIGKNIANAIFKYNISQLEQVNRIDYVRICLISGGAFLPEFMNSDAAIKAKSQQKVANQIINGINSTNNELSKETHNFDQDIVYEFAYADGAFKNAIREFSDTNDYLEPYILDGNNF